MGSAKAKSINLLLYDGNLDGVISIEDTSWNSGELYFAPRKSVNELIDTGACNKYGVYMLLSQDKVYVGQSSDLAKRIVQHTTGKLWWESVAILTTKDDSLNHSDIDYLEAVLIDKAIKTGKLDCDNKNKGNPPKVDKFRKVYLGQYLDEALFLLKLIGISVFSNSIMVTQKQNASGILIDSSDIHTRLSHGKNAKSDAISYIEGNGIQLQGKSSYAVKQECRNECWINPSVKLLNQNWNIILNNTNKQILTLLEIPAQTLHLKGQSQMGLIVRKDRPDRIEININVDTLIDKTSGVDFSPYHVKDFKY